ncbi:MAG: HD domain-containing protein [Spirochaetes bacterium]|nr:HD domain-containing protein [Spirochaetota bacterium]
MRIPAVARSLASVFAAAGRQCWLVGGAVRDLHLGRPLTDLDIATDARPEDVSQLFRAVIPTGARHGTVTVLFKGTSFEVTTFRTEERYSDGRRPDRVSFAPSILDDLSRRDFTINAMAWDLVRHRLEDPHAGRADLAARLIRAIGNPDERFNEDGLRPLRACRFAAQLGFTIEASTKEAIPRALGVVARVSAERVRDEIVKILGSPRPSDGFRLMHETGLLALTLPELASGDGLAQGDLHCWDVLTHSLMSCDAAPRDDLVLRLAALLHDVGKPPAVSAAPDGRPTFHGHERLSRSIATAVLERLRFPVAVTRDVAHLIGEHMFNYTEEWSDAAVRRLVARVGEQHIDRLIALRRADHAGMCPGNADAYPQGLALFAAHVRAVLDGAKALTVRELAVDGTDVMDRLGIPAGPAVGTVLAELLEAVLDDPALNERDHLLAIAERVYRERIVPGSRP